ncbi:MAG: protein kinase [Sandaracinaceae bacterium]|nr:protein kinase [Sandaracinaceae bacterium]
MTARPIALGSFQLVDVVGRGGMGRVFRGIHVATGEAVAVKVVSIEAAREPLFVATFRDEARVVARLDHPAIALVLDQDSVPASAAAQSRGELVEGSPYLVMELGRHGTLVDLERRAGPLPFAKVREILLDLLDALAHAHARGIVHRDIKPANVLVMGPGQSPRIKLTDFGIAHRTDVMTLPGTEVRGTPHYMAPEQIEGRACDLGPATDLYAVGCLVYALLAGRPPFGATKLGIEETLRRQLSAPPPPLVSRVPVPSGLEDWLELLLAKSPDRRFRLAADAAAVLRGLDEPVDAEGEHVTASATTDTGTLVLDRTQAPTSGWRVPSATLPSRPVRVAHDVSAARAPFARTWIDERPVPARHALTGAGLGLFGVRRAPMVGRAKERSLLWSELVRVHDTRAPRAVVVRGPSGVGKSRLCEWLVVRAHELGAANMLVARHGAHGGVGDGLGPMLARFFGTEGLGRAQATAPIARRLSALGVELAELPLVLDLTHPPPNARDGAGRTGFSSPRERHHLLLRILARLARERPVLVWIEDAQWGADAVAFVEALLDRGTACLAVLCHGDETADDSPEPPVSIDALSHRDQVTVCELAPLDAAHQAELVSRLLRLEPAIVSEVAQRSAGHPAMAIQMVSDWVQRELLLEGAGAFSVRAEALREAPVDLDDLWLRRIDRALASLGDEGRIVIERAATLGRSPDPTEWQRASADLRVSPLDVAPLLELQGLLVREDASGRAFVDGQIVHALLRDAHARGRLREHHRARARALAQSEARVEVVERRAHHHAAAGDLEAALEPALVASWQRFESSEHDRALRWLDRRDAWIDALALAADDPRRASGWIRRAHVLMRLARLPEAEPFIDRAEALARSGAHAEALADAVYARAKHAQMAGEAARALERYDEARTLYEAAHDRRGVARCDHGAGTMHLHCSRLREAEVAYERALEGFEAVGDAWSRAACLLDRADLVSQRDRVRGIALIAEAEEALAHVGNRISLASASLLRGLLLRAEGDLRGAEAAFTRSAEMLDALGSSDLAVVQTNLGMVALLERDVPRARALFEQAYATFRATGREGYLCFVHLELLACCAWSREWERFDEHCTAAETILARTGLADEDLAVTAELAAEHAARAGQLDRAARASCIGSSQRRALEAARHESEADAQRA